MSRYWQKQVPVWLELSRDADGRSVTRARAGLSLAVSLSAHDSVSHHRQVRVESAPGGPPTWSAGPGKLRPPMTQARPVCQLEMLLVTVTVLGLGAAPGSCSALGGATTANRIAASHGHWHRDGRPVGTRPPSH
jgi:hypothetical protein